MSRPLFPFVLFGYNSEETVGDTMPEVVEEIPPALTVDSRARDFRPMNIIKDRIPPAPGAKKDSSEADPKASSVMDAASSSPSESPTSPVAQGEPSVDAERESNLQGDDEAEVNSSPTGIVTPHVLESTPESPESQISSFPLL